MSKETAIQALKQLQQEIAEKKKSLRPMFETGLAELFQKHPLVKRLEISVNNHEFNDGEATYFGLYHDDMTVYFSDGIKLGSYNEEEGATKQHVAVRDEFVKFFGEFDVDGFYETIYGDAYESLTFECRAGKVVTS